MFVICKSNSSARSEKRNCLFAAFSLFFFACWPFVHRSETNTRGESERRQRKKLTQKYGNSLETNMADKETFTAKMVHVSKSVRNLY